MKEKKFCTKYFVVFSLFFENKNDKILEAKAIKKELLKSIFGLDTLTENEGKIFNFAKILIK